MRQLQILYVGVSGGTTGHRASALRALGHDLRHVACDPPRSGPWFLLHRVAQRLRRPFDYSGCNQRIRTALRHDRYDLLWVDKGNTVRPATLALARRMNPAMAIVSYSGDDMINPLNCSVNYQKGLPLYDLHVTTKSYNVPEVRDMGVRDVMFVDNSYDPHTHRPIELATADRQRYGATVGFVGTWEPDRARAMLRLAEHGVPVQIWGRQWHKFRGRHANLKIHRRFLDGDEYAKAICATRVNLAFLRKANRDLQTTRSVEIPACGGFMLAERTDEHRGLFEEGAEAEFFGDFEELLAKCVYYAERDEERTRTAAAGHRRCRSSGYSNADRLSRVLDYLERANIRS